MKKFFSIFIVLCFCMPAFAQVPAKTIKNPPVGTFKKKKDGTIVQYYKGKKVGTYKLRSK